MWAGQIAKAVGCRVVAVARGAAKAEALRKLGADVAIDTEAHPDKQLRVLIKVGYSGTAWDWRITTVRTGNVNTLLQCF
jgi:NADPH:quinone reductase-like Zn-dependent oxidoreductase